jgi:hypothetical protein
MIHVEMSEQHVDPVGPALADQLVAEWPDPGSRVEHDHGLIGETELDARGVPPVADGVRPG